MFQGESYSIGSNGIVVVGGKTLTTDIPTTATLADGKIIIVGSDGSVLVRPIITPTPLAQTGMFQGDRFSIGSNEVIIDGTTFKTATPTTATLKDGKVVVVGPSGLVSVQNSKDKSYVTPKEYFIGALLPTLLAVLFSIPWPLLVSAMREIEPFYQLQRPNGITAEDSIALDRTSLTAVAIFLALKKGHFLVSWSGLTSLMVLVVAPLASETVFIQFAGECTATSGRNTDGCNASLNVSLQAARVLQGILSIIAILTLVLAIDTRKKSGVYANPLSIAGLATLFQNPQVVDSFRQLNPYLSSKMIRSALQGQRYRIGFYKNDDGTQSYGFVRCHQDSGRVQTEFQTLFRRKKKYAAVAAGVDDNSRPKPERTFSRYLVHPASIVAFAFLIVGLEILIIYFDHTGGDTGFEKFMDSQSFGVTFLFTAIGVMLKMYWTFLDDGKWHNATVRPLAY